MRLPNKTKAARRSPAAFENQQYNTNINPHPQGTQSVAAGEVTP